MRGVSGPKRFFSCKLRLCKSRVVVGAVSNHTPKELKDQLKKLDVLANGEGYMQDGEVWLTIADYGPNNVKEKIDIYKTIYPSLRFNAIKTFTSTHIVASAGEDSKSQLELDNLFMIKNVSCNATSFESGTLRNISLDNIFNRGAAKRKLRLFEPLFPALSFSLCESRSFFSLRVCKK